MHALWQAFFTAAPARRRFFGPHMFSASGESRLMFGGDQVVDSSYTAFKSSISLNAVMQR